MRQRWLKNKILGVVNNHLVDYPTPVSLTYMWSFGSLSGLALCVQILSGVFLGMHYCAHIDMSFNSLEHIMRDVPNGWLLRYIHSNGAGIFFILVYIHMFRGLYYGSYVYPRLWLWLSGLVIYLLMMGTAFIGYVLPFGQMSLWGAIVITNLLSTIPFVGDKIVAWLLGGFIVDNATLNRFYSLHYMLPFIIAGLALLHLVLLHIDGSSNRLGIASNVSKIGFYPYSYVKDLFVLLVMLLCLSYLIYYNPNLLGHSDNYIRADSLVTPAHIVPEFYFLSFYAILRSVPSKSGGVVLMLLAIVALVLLPILNSSECRSSGLKPVTKVSYWLFVVIALLLGWLGQKPIESPYIELGQICGFFYFSILCVWLPFIGYTELRLVRKGD